MEFIKHALGYKKKVASIDWYKKLFVPKANLVSGDISPSYSALDGDAIASIARALPDLRLVLLLRDPVSRSWSQYNMSQRFEFTGHHRGKKNPSANLVSVFQKTTSAEEIAQYLRRAPVRDRSFATLIHENWSRYFDASQMSIVFFEDIVKSPEQVMKNLREDFGLSGTLRGNGRASLDFNRKANELKREMSDEVRAVLVDAFRDEMLRCAEVFGGPAEHWPRRFGIA